MFKIWIKVFDNNHLLKQITIEDDSNESRTHKVFSALDKACQEFNLSRPIWLEKNINDFKRFSRVKFTKDSFIDEIEFDFLEMQMLEED